MNTNTIILYAGWAALAGALIPVMAALQGLVGRTLQSPLHASLIAVGMAVVAVGVVLSLFRPAKPAGNLFAAASPMYGSAVWSWRSTRNGAGIVLLLHPRDDASNSFQSWHE